MYYNETLYDYETLQTLSLKRSIENRAIFDMYLVRTVPEVS